MSSEEHYLEENIARLIQAGYSPEVRPSPQTREKTFESLASQLRSEKTATEFPVCVLGLLFCALVLMAVWLATQMVGVNTSVTLFVPFAVIAIALLLNLVFVPVAGIVIVIRRRYAQI